MSEFSRTNSAWTGALLYNHRVLHLIKIGGINVESFTIVESGSP